MSMVSQGQGWWLASDGFWYAPERHPDNVADDIDIRAASAVNVHQGNGSWLVPDGSVYSPAVSTAGQPPQSVATAPRRAVDDVYVSAHAKDRISTRSRSALMVLMTLIVLGGAGALTYSLTSRSSSIVGDSPSTAIALATSAVEGAGSVRVVTTIQLPGQTVTYVNDSTGQSGQQVISSSSGIRMTVLVVDGSAYLNVNPTAMTTLFRTPATITQRFANKWLSFPAGSQAYKSIAETLTLTSLLQEVTPVRPITKLPPSVINGQSAIGFRGELPGDLPGTLYLSSVGPPLPVEEISSTPKGVTTAIFSDWGEAVHVTVPPGAIAGTAAGLS